LSRHKKDLDNPQNPVLNQPSRSKSIRTALVLHPAWLPQLSKVQEENCWRVLDSVPQIFGCAMVKPKTNNKDKTMSR
jgi:hypothetical protein